MCHRAWVLDCRSGETEGHRPARVLTEEGLVIHSAKMASCRPKRVHRAALAEISNASVLCYKEDGRAHELGP